MVGHVLGIAAALVAGRSQLYDNKLFQSVSGLYWTPTSQSVDQQALGELASAAWPTGLNRYQVLR